MTEAEWLACTEPLSMLDILQRKASDRKLRLFAVACCHRVWRFMPVQGRDAVTLAEQYADGMKVGDRLGRESQVASGLTSQVSPRIASILQACADASSTGRPTSVSAMRAAVMIADAVAIGHERTGTAHLRHTVAWNEEMREQSRLTRDVFGNPFRSVATDLRWRTSSTVLGLASAIYADRAFDRLPILADALEEAGCDHADVLAHCRGDGPHVRGCWVVDLILGKE